MRSSARVSEECLEIVGAYISMNPPLPGCKLPEELENPLDTYLMRLLLPVMPMLHRLGVTPNTLTLASCLCAFSSLCLFMKERWVAASAMWLLNYVFDVADGMLARLFDMQTVTGSVADHLSDTCSVIGLYACVLWKMHRHGIRTVWPLVVGLVLMSCAMQQYICQERWSQERHPDFIPVEGVNPLMCTDTETLRWSRFFGVGTMTLWHVLLLCLYSRAASK